MEIQRLSFCRSYGSSSPWVLRYFASSHGKERERTGNVHLFLNYLILEMTQGLLHTILHKFREKERHKLWCTVTCLFHHPILWPLNICEYPSYPWNKVISPSSQLSLTFSNFFIQLKVQKNFWVPSIRYGCNSSSSNVYVCFLK